MRLKNFFRQRKHTKRHRELERADGFRLVSLTDYPVPSYNGYRPWCDAVLQDCFVPGDDLCCYCQHSDTDPRMKAQEDRNRE